MNFKTLKNEPRLLLEVDLTPVQGTRFQPTGFPDLGAADYQTSSRKRMLIVESAQSMANRLEAVCWNDGDSRVIDKLDGIPYVESTLPDETKTNSVLEAHRLNSPYIVNSEGFDSIREAIGFVKNKPFDRRKLAKALARYDLFSLLHGVFLEKVGGVVRLPRALSAFIEAEDVAVAPAGGVKIDRVQPGTTGESTPYGKAKDGYGNVPYHRDEYSAERIVAYFNLDLAQLRGYALGSNVTQLLIAIALFKIQRFLRDGLRLRTACDLEPASELKVKRPESFEMPALDEIETALPALIKDAKEHFADPPVTQVRYQA